MDQSQARQNLRLLLDKYYRLNEDERDAFSERDVIQQFVTELLGNVLGWRINDPSYFRYEKTSEGGRPDMTFYPLGESKKDDFAPIFVEAKRFGVIASLRQALDGTMKPEQMRLPTLATDRTPEEQQAINYAFRAGAKWAILTNFEKLRLFNARRDWLVISFEIPRAYEHDFEELWQLAYENILNGSLDNLSERRFRPDVDTEYLDLINVWREKLAKDLLNNIALNPWLIDAQGKPRLDLLRAVVQRLIDRLVVVRFAEDHHVITADTLRRINIASSELPDYYAPQFSRILQEFFARFDKMHNSALFAPHAVDHAHFSNAMLNGLVADLYRARYRAMTADIIGNTYEQYLGQTLELIDENIATQDNLETRKKQGSYYTPQFIVRYIVDNTLGRYLYGTANGRPDGEPLPDLTRKTSRDIIGLKVLDNACGSGSFLIYAYEVLREFYESEIKRLREIVNARLDSLSAQGITDPIEQRLHIAEPYAEIKRLQEHYPYLILETHLYGVDLDPQAAEIAAVNLIMRALEGRHQDKILPLILNQNIKVGNSLIGLIAETTALEKYGPELATLRQLRYALTKTAALGHDEATIKSLEAQTHALAERLSQEMALNAYFTDLDTVKPFHWLAEFPEVFVDERGQPLEQGGFTIIIGNPPYGAPYRSEEAFLRQSFETATCNDRYALFMENALRLLSHTQGLMGMIVPSGWVSAPMMSPLREVFKKNLHPLAFVTLPYDVFPDAYVDTVIYVAKYHHAMVAVESESLINLVVFPPRYKIKNGEDFKAFSRLGDFSTWYQTASAEFLITLSVTEQRIIEKVKGASLEFQEMMDIQRGVTPFQLTPTPPETNPYPALSGQVRRYALENTTQYIRYDETLNEYKPLKYFVGSRLLLREIISRQFRLQATFTQDDFITNKSMQSLLLKSEQYNIFYVLGLLNSRLLSWYFLATSSVARRDDFPKIVLTQTRHLPFKPIDFANAREVEIYHKMSELVPLMLRENVATDEDSPISLTETDDQIDRLVYELYGLTAEEIAIVEGR